MPEKLDPDLVVIGHQWWWEARYPKSGVVTANEIHIPAGRRLLVRLESADVIHDFWVPRLARKMDMVPGHPNHIWLEADKPGAYAGACAEYCGAQHAWMRFQWSPKRLLSSRLGRQSNSSRQPSPARLPRRGARRFSSRRPAPACHDIKGTPARARVGPDLTHLAERRNLAAGLLENTSTNLAKWLKNPQALKSGCHMPNLRLTEEQVADLASYLERQTPAVPGRNTTVPATERVSRPRISDRGWDALEAGETPAPPQTLQGGGR